MYICICIHAYVHIHILGIMIYLCPVRICVDIHTHVWGRLSVCHYVSEPEGNAHLHAEIWDFHAYGLRPVTDLDCFRFLNNTCGFPWDSVTVRRDMRLQFTLLELA